MSFHACWLHYIYDTMCTWFNLNRRWHLKHRDQNKIAAILQTTFSDAFYWMKTFAFWSMMTQFNDAYMRHRPQWVKNVVLPSFLLIAHARLPGETKKLPFCGWNFQIHFLEWKYFNFRYNYIESRQIIYIGSSNIWCCVELATSPPFSEPMLVFFTGACMRH